MITDGLAQKLLGSSFHVQRPTVEPSVPIEAGMAYKRRRLSQGASTDETADHEGLIAEPGPSSPRATIGEVC